MGPGNGQGLSTSRAFASRSSSGASRAPPNTSPARRSRRSYIDPNGGVNSDKNNSLSQLGVAWDDSASKAQMQERIITQKWIANWQLGNEAWADYRRTGFPRLILAMESPCATTSSVVRTRNSAPAACPIPPRRATSNAENYAKAVEMLGGSDNMATRIWWDCNPDVK